MLNQSKNDKAVMAFVCATLFWVAVLGWATSYSPTDPQKKACYETAAKSGRDTSECKTFWERTTSEPIALFTFFLAFSTVGLWAATIGLYSAGERQLAHFEDTAKRELRAYISIKEMLMQQYRGPDIVSILKDVGLVPGQIHSYRICAVIENGGPTPTRMGLININHELRDDRLPNDFGFLDGDKTEFAAIGARGEYQSPHFFVTISDVEKIVAKKKKLYVWGWIDYNDVFDGTPRHRTEFCYDITPDEIPNKGDIYLRFPAFGRFNGVDGDCVRQPSPYKEPQS
jgi:hypothetical protein